MTSLCEKIRSYLKVQPAILPASMVAKEINEPEKHVMYALSVMSRRDGTVSKERIGKLMHYGFLRDRCRRVARPKAKRVQSSFNKPAPKRVNTVDLRRQSVPSGKSCTMQRMNSGSAAVAFDKLEPSRFGRAETIEEFLARGGQVQRLDPTETSIPLRFMTDID